MNGGWRTYFTNMQNKFDRHKIRTYTELRRGFPHLKIDQTVVCINMVRNKDSAEFDY